MGSPKLTISIFGTQGTWRDVFIRKYESLGLQYYVSMNALWWDNNTHNEEMAHVINDDIVIYTIARDSTAHIELTLLPTVLEHAMYTKKHKYFIFCIADTCDVVAEDGVEEMAKTISIDRRQKAIDQVLPIANTHDNVFLLNNIQTAYTLSVELYCNLRDLRALTHNPLYTYKK